MREIPLIAALALMAAISAGCGRSETEPQPFRAGWFLAENETIQIRVWFDEYATSNIDPASPTTSTREYLVTVSRQGSDVLRVTIKTVRNVEGGDVGEEFIFSAKLNAEAGRIDVPGDAPEAAYMLFALFAPAIEFKTDARSAALNFFPRLKDVENQSMSVTYTLEDSQTQSRPDGAKIRGEGAFVIETEDQAGNETLSIDGRSSLDVETGRYASGEAVLTDECKVAFKTERWPPIEITKRRTWHWEMVK